MYSILYSLDNELQELESEFKELLHIEEGQAENEIDFGIITQEDYESVLVEHLTHLLMQVSTLYDNMIAKLLSQTNRNSRNTTSATEWFLRNITFILSLIFQAFFLIVLGRLLFTTSFQCFEKR